MKDKTKITRISDKEPSLEKLQKLVGGYIEVAYDDGKTQIICNEEGKLHGQPFNSDATMEWGKLINAEPRDILVGDVVILSGKALLT